jgi:hypothetical protein
MIDFSEAGPCQLSSVYFSRPHPTLVQLSSNLRVTYGESDGTGFRRKTSESRHHSQYGPPPADVNAAAHERFSNAQIRGTGFRREESVMKTRALQWLSLLSLVFAIVMVAPRLAAADDDDPPGRVARLSLTNGEVSFSPAGTDDWVSAVVNRPITTGDKIWTDKGGRAELHVGSAAIRLSGETGFSFLNLSDRMMQVRLTEGTIILRVRRLGQEESIEIDTPNLAFSVLRPGRYRINVNDAGDTTVVKVRDGEGEVTGGGSAYAVHAGEQGYFTGTDSLNADMQSLADSDDFDHWCNERDLREDHAVARRYVSDDVIGYEDLDDYGGWRPVPEYGTIWFPHVTVVGWAPYRYGHWTWISPWGWTWVDDAPWGFAPFHYGRWVYVTGAWGWVPCPPPVVAVAYVRPVYAPALVAWVGGPHFAAGIAFGGGFAAGVNVGWFPLGPREVFVPSYPVSRTYVNNVNISNTNVNQTVINNYYNNTVVNKNVTVNNVNVNNNIRYANQNVPGAVTATSPHAFTSAQPVSRNMVAVNQKEIVSAPAAAVAPAVVPPKQAVLGSGVSTNVHPPASLQSRAVVAKTAPPPPPPTFAARQTAIQANQGRPISIAEVRQLQTESTHATVLPVHIAPPSTPATPQINTVQGAGNRPIQSVQQPVQQKVQQNVQQPVQQPVQTNANRPPNAGGTQTNPVGNANNPRIFNDRPPTSRPVVTENPQLEQKHQQQVQQLQQKQDQEWQKLQQKQNTEQQKIQQNTAEQARQQQIQEKQQQELERQQQLQKQHEQQLQQLQEKHAQQQQELHQKQQVEHTQAAQKPTKPEKPPKEDKPHR